MLRALFGLVLTLIALPGVSSPANDSPQALMRELYRVHDQGKGPLLDPKAKAQRRIYFTEALAAALDQELNRPNSDEVGNLDFDPFYYAQDTEVGDIDFAVPKVSGKEVNVLARFTNFGESREITYRVVQGERGWHIDDILYGEGDTLRKILRGGE